MRESSNTLPLSSPPQQPSASLCLAFQALVSVPQQENKTFNSSGQTNVVIPFLVRDSVHWEVKPSARSRQLQYAFFSTAQWPISREKRTIDHFNVFLVIFLRKRLISNEFTAGASSLFLKGKGDNNPASIDGIFLSFRAF